MNTNIVKLAVLSLGVMTGISCQNNSQAPGKNRTSNPPSAETLMQPDTCRQNLFDGPYRFWLPQDDTAFFDAFFAKAEAAQGDKRTLRVLHYGDSHIEADRITAQVRERMQTLFGGGGPGLVPLKQTVPALTVRQRTDGKLIGQSTYGNKPFVHCDGNYGPMLRSWNINGDATLKLATERGRYAPEHGRSFSRVRIIMRNASAPTVMHITAADSTSTHKCTQQGLQLLELCQTGQTERMELSLQGQSDIYGLLLDNDYGVAVDNIGMRGSAGTQFTMVDSLQLAQVYRSMDVGMILLQFGGNAMVGMNSTSQIKNYCKRIGAQIDYLHSVCPEAAIMFIGLADMGVKHGGTLGSHPMIASLDASLRDTVLVHDAAYWSVFRAMGGDGAMAQWVSQGLANKDYIHFSYNGAAQMGNLMADALERQYQFYRLRKAII